MRLPGFLDRFVTRRFGSFTIDDPRPIQQSAPYTFFLPEMEYLAAVQVGDHVKAIFRPVPQNRCYDAERMWVIVESVNDEGFSGRLDNEPTDMPQLSVGTPVFVPRTHVIQVTWAENHEPPIEVEYPEYWERCFVDDCVLRGASHVDYLYREGPAPSATDDKYPDSGWRLRGTDGEIAADERAGRSFQYIAVGVVLNSDDRWLHLIDAPAGSAFQWNDVSGEYESSDD